MILYVFALLAVLLAGASQRWGAENREGFC
jgi:hypothetical protein